MVFGCAHAPRGFVIPAKASNFVIPAKAGIQLLAFAFDLLWTSAYRETRPTSVCISRASLRASHFLLLAQEKVTKEKGTPATAVAGHRARRLREGAAEVR